ncbi:transposase [Streptomyces sp. NBC_00211]|uniref:transposase n=1 Tax=Streptomyces sp. NBC_00211 TaxID=2975683 RepID=UPI00386315F2
MHVVLDNGSAHTARYTKTWLADHSRWHVHWTPPHASWLNQIELVFSALTRRVLRHGDFSSRDDLIDTMDTYMIKRNETARPFKWTYAASPLQAGRTPLHEYSRSSTSVLRRRSVGRSGRVSRGSLRLSWSR